MIFAFIAFAAAVGVFVSKYRARWQSRPARVAVVASPSPAASPRPSPIPATPAATAVVSSPAAGDEWREWKTAALEITRGTIKPAFSIVAPSNALRVFGNGSGIGGAQDEGAFYFRVIEGDWIFLARVVAHDRAAGLSLRDSPVSAASGLSIWLGNDGTVGAATRKPAETKPTPIAQITSAKVEWLRLSRRGAIVTAEYSANAKQWKVLARLEGVTLPSKPVAGFIVWSGAKDRTATGVFDHVSITRIK
jgi:hypothetical protein